MEITDPSQSLRQLQKSLNSCKGTMNGFSSKEQSAYTFTVRIFKRCSTETAVTTLVDDAPINMDMGKVTVGCMLDLPKDLTLSVTNPCHRECIIMEFVVITLIGLSLTFQVVFSL